MQTVVLNVNTVYLFDGSYMDDHRLPDSFIENMKTRSLPEVSSHNSTPGTFVRHYRILQELGSGAMGNVFKAIDTRTNKIVAIKCIRASQNQSHRDRFIREYKLLSSIDHENLIHAYELFEENDYLFMVLEYIDGASLEDTLSQKVSLSLSDKLAIANKICRGIEVLNLAGIVHRDIKPDNIMINSTQGRTKILDLGIGKNIKQGGTDLTLEGEVLGTAMYLSPEQTKGKITATSDIFSVGIVLYQLFTNTHRSPFEKKGIFECFFAINTFSPPTIEDVMCSQQPQWLYSEISKVVSKAMDKDSNRRWQSAGMMANAFAELHRKLQSSSLQMGNFNITAISPQLLRSLNSVRMTLRDNDLIAHYVPKADSKIAKTSRHTTRRRLDKYKYKDKSKLTHSFAIIGLISGVIIGMVVIFVMHNATPSLNNDEETQRSATKVFVQPPSTAPLPEEIWKKCWNEEQQCFDFTQLAWKNLRHNLQAQYATDYQKWYAQQNKLPVEKDFVLRQISIKMVLIPPGIFIMGSPYFERGRSSEEQQHKVHISKCFWLGKYELTRQQWKDVTGENPAIQNLQVRGDHPIVSVSHTDIHKKLLKRLDRNFDLPTEAQWEYACRAGTTSIYYWGNDIGFIGEHANLADKMLQRISFRLNKKISDGFYTLAPVGSLQQNPFFLHDMIGNVWEWNRDFYGKYQQLDQVQKDPVTTKGNDISIRSGSWSLIEENLMRSASRRAFPPTERVNFVGLRLMRHHSNN